ncbi:putative uncharacterized protein [Clostridium sp. CAG:813]|nr:putative uncharacterized protein [Clostridium sp. CAG:813]
MVNKIANIYNYIIELYKNELSYEAAKLETKRKLFVCLYKGCKFLCWGTVIFAIIFTLGYYLFLTGYQSEQQTPEHIIGAGIPIMVTFGIFACFCHSIGTIIQNLFASEAKKKLFSKIYKALDSRLTYFPGKFKLPICWYDWEQFFEMFQKQNANHDILKTEIKKLNIFPHYHYIRIDDVILGTYNEHPVQIIEFNLIEKIFERTSKGGHRRHYIEVFKGVLFQTSMEKNVKADILIKNRCSNLHSNILREKINLESNDFEKQFEVYSNDQIEARYFLTTATIDNLLKINNAKQRISGYISGRNVNLLLHSDKDMFEPSIYKELDNPNNYSELIFQAKSILDLITSLKLDSKTGL